MEDVLSVYARPYNERLPVICMDEKPVQLFANARKSIRSKDGRIEYEDNEYIRNGTACIFLFTEPLNGWRFADYPNLWKIRTLNEHSPMQEELYLERFGFYLGCVMLR